MMEAGHAGELIHVQAQASNVTEIGNPGRAKVGKSPVSLHVV